MTGEQSQTCGPEGWSGLRKPAAARAGGRPLECGGKRQRHAAFGVTQRGGGGVLRATPGSLPEIPSKGGVALSLATAVQGQAAAATFLNCSRHIRYFAPKSASRSATSSAVSVFSSPGGIVLTAAFSVFTTTFL